MQHCNIKHISDTTLLLLTKRSRALGSISHHKQNKNLIKQIPYEKYKERSSCRLQQPMLSFTRGFRIATNLYDLTDYYTQKVNQLKA